MSSANPVPVTAFEHDLYFPPRAGRVAAEQLPRGQFAEIRGSAHGGLMTHPQECIRALLAFLAESAPPS